jgi:hypothetical protein
MQFTHFGQKFRGKIDFAQYDNNGNRAVQLSSFNEEYQGWEPFATLSVNTDETLPENEFVAKTYSENEGLVEQFIEMGLFEDTGKTVICGYAGPQPVLRIVENG